MSDYKLSPWSTNRFWKVYCDACFTFMNHAESNLNGDTIFVLEMQGWEVGRGGIFCSACVSGRKEKS